MMRSMLSRCAKVLQQPALGSEHKSESSMEIVLYYAPVTCALAPYITLSEANASFEVRPLNLRKNQHHSPDYLKLNPKHKVPLLVIDGQVLSESVAIQTWIARSFPQARL